MPSKEIIRLEAGRFRLLTDQLKCDFSDIDDETLLDTLEGLSDLPQMLEAIVRSSLEDECLIEALKLRIETMNARLTRFKERFGKKRELCAWAMGSAGIDKMEVVDFSVSLSEGALKADVPDATKLPELFLIPVPPKIDRIHLLAALKNGDVVEGASLIRGEAHITVRAR